MRNRIPEFLKKFEDMYGKTLKVTPIKRDNPEFTPGVYKFRVTIADNPFFESIGFPMTRRGRDLISELVYRVFEREACFNADGSVFYFFEE